MMRASETQFMTCWTDKDRGRGIQIGGDGKTSVANGTWAVITDQEASAIQANVTKLVNGQLPLKKCQK
jgi:hypothetical protein